MALVLLAQTLTRKIGTSEGCAIFDLSGCNVQNHFPGIEERIQIFSITIC